MCVPSVGYCVEKEEKDISIASVTAVGQDKAEHCHPSCYCFTEEKAMVSCKW